ncbi:DnaD domain protein [Neobacillus sp. M.A.Huq-85]
MNNPVWQDPKLLKLWMLCLLEASHKEHEQLVGKQIIKLKPGQFVTGRHSLFAEFNRGAKKSDIVPESTLWRWMKFLESNSFVNIKSYTKFSVVSILNWHSYQQNEQQMNSTFEGFHQIEQKNEQKNEQQNMQGYPYVSRGSEFTNQENEQQMNNKWTANEQQVNTNNNGNNENKKDTTTTENPIVYFEKVLCRLSTVQMNKLYAWLDDFNGQAEIINEAIDIADSRNKRTYGFVEFLLKEWANSKLDSLDRVRAYEQEKFNKQKPVRAGKYTKPIRQEQVPEYMDREYVPGPVDQSELDAKKRAVEEKLKSFRGG